MKNILAIDTSSVACSVTLLTNNNIYSARDLSNNSSAVILPLIDKLINESKIDKKDITDIIYTNGPGSFTSVRVGISVVQGLSLGWGAKTYGVSSLLALGLTAAKKYGDGTYDCMLDARMGEIYVATCSVKNNNVTISTPVVIKPDNFNNKYQAVGTGAEVYYDYRGDVLYPCTDCLAEYLLNNELRQDDEISPQYVRNPKFVEYDPKSVLSKEDE